MSEQSLEEEIEQLKNGEILNSQEDGVETAETEEDAKTKKEDIVTAREEMLKQLRSYCRRATRLPPY